MRCESMKEKIALYATGDLPSKEVSNVEHHLNSCVACEMYHEEMRGLADELQTLSTMDVPGLNTAAVFDALEQPVNHSRSWRVPAVVSAFAALLIVSSLLRPDVLNDTPVEIKLTKTVPAETVQHLEAAAPVIPDAEFASDLVQDVPSTKIILYTDDPNVVIHWFGD
ncbi:MAG: hypothetical protein VCD00_04440 [Candidatus Hydrogenedentota bacterium]